MKALPVPTEPSPAASLIEEIQRRSGLSQAELARRAGISRSVLNVYLRGRREPGTETLLRIASAAGLRIQVGERTSPVDPDRASGILVQVLELAEALPFRPRAEMQYPPLAKRLGERTAPV
ncbi:MAG TPA: helix-turn-helix transcriptional regulator [Solirubrobacterales bacterium]|jgi:transcriptional regulator with XRE-family HTH domain|nr:helix-turn-helix transcriptional regulator [Solirubrobacterales bacterium]